jgi:hypothetical protein
MPWGYTRSGPVVLNDGELYLGEGGCFAMDGRDGVERIYRLTQIGTYTCSVAPVDVDCIPRSGIHTESVIKCLDSGAARPCSLVPR